MNIGGLNISSQEIMQIVKRTVACILAKTGYKFNREDVEDMCGNVLHNIIRSSHTYNPNRAALTTWINRIAFNCINDAIGEKCRMPKCINVEEKIFSVNMSIDEKLSFMKGEIVSDYDEREDCRNLVRKAIDSIPNEDRRLALTMELDGCETNEIASKLHKTPNAVYALLNRARNDLNPTLLYMPFTFCRTGNLA